MIGSKIKNGHPITISAWGVDDKLLSACSIEQQNMVINWIKSNIKPRKTPLKKRTSYGIKHILDCDLRIYLTNNQFKDAMLICGFKPVDVSAINWTFCISKKSPAFLSSMPAKYMGKDEEKALEGMDDLK